jgi:hypothetical protein
MAGIVILVDIWTLGGKPRALFLSLLRVLPTFAVAIVNSLFLYLLCSRSLLK